MEHLQEFDHIIDTVQKAASIPVSEKQQAAFQKKYKFVPVFEYGQDEAGRFIIRANETMFEAMEYHLALEYDRDAIDLLMKARLNGALYVSVSYSADALHLKELFAFLEENR